VRPIRSELRERPGVVIRERLAVELGDEAVVVPDLEVLDLAKTSTSPLMPAASRDRRGNQTRPCASNSPTWP
jgi:hypothetical protein